MKRKSTPNPTYVYKRATHWRMRAEEMRTLAEEARDPMVRAMMLGIAADCDSFAESADDGAIGGSIMFRLAEKGTPRSSGFNRAATSERRPAFSGARL